MVGTAPDEAVCSVQASRDFFDMVDLDRASIAIAAVTKINAIFAIERAVNGFAVYERCSAALFIDLEAWLRADRAKFSAMLRR